MKVESVNLYVESGWQSGTSPPPKQRGLPELVSQLTGDMCAYESRLRIPAAACFRDVNKNLGLGLSPLWLTDFSIDLYLLANEIKNDNRNTINLSQLAVSMSLWCILHFDYFKVYYFVLNYSVFLALAKINLFYFLLFMHSVMLLGHI